MACRIRSRDNAHFTRTTRPGIAIDPLAQGSPKGAMCNAPLHLGSKFRFCWAEPGCWVLADGVLLMVSSCPAQASNWSCASTASTTREQGVARNG